MTTKYIIMQYISYKFLLLFLVYSWAACNQEEEKMAGPMVDPDKLHVQPLSPWEALSTFEVEDGFEIELVASEPDVVDPMAIEFDENGRMYVVEMRYYPLIDSVSANLGRIRLLEDTDGNGVFDKSTIFADNLRFPTAVFCYDGGVFVASTPDLLYLKDTSGDGIADVKKTVMSGFGTSGHPAFFVQQMPNSFKWGLDNRIHAVTSGNGGKINIEGESSDDVTEIRGQDFSFDPKTMDLSRESGGMQHGMSFDDWGRKFITRQSSHIEQVMYDYKYAERNPSFSMPGSHISIAEDGMAAEVYRLSEHEPWRELRTKWTVEGLLVRDENMVLQWQEPGGDRAVWQGGVGYDGGSFITSSSGLTIYKGDAWPEAYRGSSFIAEPTGNLIHRDSLYFKDNSISMSATRPSAGLKSEFVASTDTWFRPVQFTNAPDGCLYIADMYREVIDLPSGIPDVIRQYFDLHNGNDKGRIYRIVPENFVQPPKINLGDFTTPQLVSAIEHTNGWHQTTASRLLYQRQDESAVPLLEDLVKNSKNPIGRMRAMYVLDGYNALSSEILIIGLTDEHNGVRRHAIKLSEKHFDESDPEIQRMITNKWLGMINDPDLEIQYQLAFSLDKLRQQDKINGLKSLIMNRGENSWMQAAVLSSLRTDGVMLFKELVNEKVVDNNHELGKFLTRLASMIGTQNNADQVNQILEVISNLDDESKTFDFVVALGNGMRQTNDNLDFKSDQKLSNIFDRALTTTEDPDSDMAQKMSAIQLIGLSDVEFALEKIAPFLDATNPPEIGSVAFQTLSRYNDPATTTKILEKWPEIIPTLRPKMINYFLGRTDRILMFLKEIQSGKISSKLLSSNQVRFLRSHSDEEVQKIAKNTLPDFDGERQSIIDSYQAVLNIQGDKISGLDIFRRKCSICHQIDSIGTAIGPDLVTLDSRRAKLLVDIIDPNRDVSPEYLYNTVETNDGETMSGIITNETANNLTIKDSAGGIKTILRSNIKSINSFEYSLMPVGLEADLSIDEMADLLQFIEESGT